MPRVKLLAVALLKCLEPVTAIGCGLGALALGTFDGGITAGAVIGGSGLIRAYGEARSQHGLDSQKHMDRTRLAIDRASDRDSLDAAGRASLIRADEALAKHLVNAVPDRVALGAAAVNVDRYPAAASALILDRLEMLDPLFRDDAIARDFATQVITAALGEALNNPDYIALLQVHILTAIGQGVAQANHKLDRLLALVEGSPLTDQALRGAIARFIAIRPDAAEGEVVEAVAQFERDYRALLEQVSHISVNDNHIQSLKVAAEEALAAGDIATARQRYREAAKAATDKATEPARNAAALKAAEASVALTMLDWQSADTAWTQAAAMVMPFNEDAGEDIVWEAAVRLWQFGETFGQTLALIASAQRWRALETAAAARGNAKRAASAQNNLGLVLQVQGERTGGEAGLRLLGEAVDAYRAALTVHIEAAMPADWAMTQNNLGNVLAVQGERTGSEAGLRLLGEAVAAYRAALTVYTEAAMPAQWAGTQNNLGIVLARQGERTGGEAGLDLLGEAVAAFHASLTVRTEAAMPYHYGVTTRNLAGTEALIATLRG